MLLTYGVPGAGTVRVRTLVSSEEVDQNAVVVIEVLGTKAPIARAWSTGKAVCLTNVEQLTGLQIASEHALTEGFSGFKITSRYTPHHPKNRHPRGTRIGIRGRS